MLLLSTGLSIGILSSSLSNKKEFDTLKGKLKRMENLVQDLQDELEMKEGLTVKELSNETCGEHDGKVSTVKKIITFCNLFKAKAYVYLSIYLLLIDNNNNGKIHGVDPEPMSKIEAELEAELARLELNITSKRLEEETSDFNEVMILRRNTFHTSEVA